MYLWPINDSLSQFLHIPVGHWLRVCKPSSKYLQNMWHIGCEKRNMYCIAENFRGIKTFTNFEVREPSTKVFFTKFWGMPHPLMFDLKQSVKVFSMKFSLPTAVKVFSHGSLPLYGIFQIFIYNLESIAATELNFKVITLTSSCYTHKCHAQFQLGWGSGYINHIKKKKSCLTLAAHRRLALPTNIGE